MNYIDNLLRNNFITFQLSVPRKKQAFRRQCSMATKWGIHYSYEEIKK